MDEYERLARELSWAMKHCDVHPAPNKTLWQKIKEWWFLRRILN